jgi:hypothetical protein
MDPICEGKSHPIIRCLIILNDTLATCRFQKMDSASRFG